MEYICRYGIHSYLRMYSIRTCVTLHAYLVTRTCFCPVGVTGGFQNPRPSKSTKTLPKSSKNHPRSLLEHKTSPKCFPKYQLVRFLKIFGRSKKHSFFGIAPKRQRKQTQSTPVRPVSAKGLKMLTFGLPFCIDFSTFS